MTALTIPSFLRMCVASIVSLGLALCASGPARAQTTLLALDSDPGDFVGGGQHLRFTAADGTFSVRSNFRNSVSILFESSDFFPFWQLFFAAPANKTLAVGVYTGATGSQSAGRPGLDVSGEGRGCNTLTGSFEIKEIAYGPDSEILVFWATFEQHCEGAVPALRGEVRINAQLAVFVVAPSEEAIEVGKPLSFTVTTTRFTAGAVALTATGLPTGALFTDHGDGTGTFSWTPGPSQVGPHSIVFQADDGHGGTGSIPILVKVYGGTVLILDSQPGDDVGRGQHLTLLPSDGTLSGFRNFLNGVSLEFGSDLSWLLDFAAPDGQPLAVGTYPGAQRFPFEAAGRPGLSVVSDFGACNTVTGSFEIKQVVYGPNNTVSGFWATFEQHCDGAGPALLGEVRLNVGFVPSDTHAEVWIGLGNSDDVGLRVDLLAEVFVKVGAKETRVGQGQLDDRPTGGSGFGNAILNRITIHPTEDAGPAPSGAQLEFRLSARRTCSGGGHRSGTVSLWYGGHSVDEGSARDAGSRFAAAAGGGSDTDYFLRDNLALSPTAGSHRLAVKRFVNSSAGCPGRPFTPFDNWSLAIP